MRLKFFDLSLDVLGMVIISSFLRGLSLGHQLSDSGLGLSQVGGGDQVGIATLLSFSH